MTTPYSNVWIKLWCLASRSKINNIVAHSSLVDKPHSDVGSGVNRVDFGFHVLLCPDSDSSPRAPLSAFTPVAQRAMQAAWV
jgi:hypothetical protein